MTPHKIVLLSGDGIGPEITCVAKELLEAVSKKHGFKLIYEEHPFGGTAIELKGEIPSAMNPPSGCVFRTRCPNPTHDCKEGNIEMGLIEVEPGHWVDQCCVNCG